MKADDSFSISTHCTYPSGTSKSLESQGGASPVGGGRTIGRMSGRRRGSNSKARALTEGTLIGLLFIQKYRFLTISQFARCASFSAYHAAEVLRDLERWGYLGYFGFVGIPGRGKTPKVYYLRKKGYELLLQEGDWEEIGPFSEAHKEVTWSPHMYHRLRTIDLLISLECALAQRPHLTMIKSFLEYRMVKQKLFVARETTDYVGKEQISENKLVPDAAFILENTESGKRALFFLEMDMATEQIVSSSRKNVRASVIFKLRQYERYLQSMHYADKYEEYGEFRFFTLLFVCLSAKRIENIQREIAGFSTMLANYYRFAAFEAAMGDFLGAVWQSGKIGDTGLYPLVREG